MHSITDIIKPISLKSGSHPDTAKTGQGCFMNVIAYLNGESQITDQSSCVCVTIRPIAIFANDFLKDDERNALIPFIERAMRSATADHAEMMRRLDLVVVFANKQKNIAKAYAVNANAKAYAYAAKAYAYDAKAYAKAYAYAAKAYAYDAKAYAKAYAYAAKAYAYDAKAYAYAAVKAAAYAAAANAAAKAANAANTYAAMREEIKIAIFEFMDGVCPPAQEFNCEIINRAEKFAKIAVHE